VPPFIDLLYGKYMTDEEQRVFAAGLAEVEAAAGRRFPAARAGAAGRVLTKIAVARSIARRPSSI
jgi:hypothetical protein